MKLVRDLERSLEHLVEGVTGRVFRGHLHPAELAGRLIREADLATFPTEAGPATCNVYRLLVHPDDLGDTQVPAELERELEAVLGDAAVERGWRLEGPPTVRVQPDPSVRAGAAEWQGEVRKGRLEPWAHLMGETSLAVGPNRALVGRSSTCDVVVNEPQVSRRHALLWREGGSAWLVDLGSSNGTRVEGRLVGEDRMAVDPGAVVTFGKARFTFQTR
ncbi:MAG: FhaA domain-containing protein [Acidimicrobiia bacterium]